MNRNRKVRLAATLLTTGLTITSTGLTAFANPIAGATAMLSTDVSITETTNSYTTLSGINLAMANMLSSATAAANAVQEPQENETTVVASSDKKEKEDDEDDISDIAIAKVDDYVNVRAHATEDSEVVGKLYHNGAATVLKKKGSWYKIKSGSVVGFVKAKYVTVGDEKAIKNASRRVATVLADTLYVRSKASKKSDVIGMVPKNEDLTVTSEKKSEDGWVKVSVEEGDGYVSTKYVDLSTEYTYAESKAEEEARLAAEAAAREAAEQAAAAAEAAQRAAASAPVTQSTPSGGGTTTTQPSYTAPSGGSGSSVVNYASQFVGNPYVYGGSSLTNGTDCSGFVMSVYSAFGVSLPHSSSGDRSVGYAVSTSDMQPGDIVCYSGHVAIYAGNGTIVHASNPRTGITYGNVNYRQILAVRRVL